MEMHAFGHLISVSQARARLLRAARPTRRTETLPVERSFGRVAAATYRAPRPVPHFARATWDGYAVRTVDTRSASARRPVELRIVGEVFAEQSYAGRLGAGQAVAIATGGAVPRGADGVVIFEEVDRRSDRIVLRKPVEVGDRYSRPGHDFPRGAVLVRRGEELTAVALGTLAACGIANVRVYARPVVAIVPNGNELVAPGRRAGPGQIYESNNATLASVVLAAGGDPRPIPPLPDDPRKIEAALRRALRSADLVLATGGSSVGERDHLPRILPRLGRLLFHGIAVRAGKPTLAADVRGRLVVGMPGHPTSCLINMYWLVLPALRKIGRRAGPGWVEGTAVLGSDAVAPTPGLSTVVPLEFHDGRAFTTFRGSSIITSLAGATAFAMLPPGRRRVRAGTTLRVYRLVPPLGTGAPSEGRRARNG
ncbi:MAG TPA: molybdopterin molybdotransferase MoeA [Thermoplasmata archaeon]|nr:molybdopterin molybdotransferase MoeA [Thermoplasmata archaeon]